MNRHALSLLLAAALASCTSIGTSRKQRVDPVVTVHGAGVDELGVSTDYGVVFLGQTAQTGRIEFSAWFGDGPSREEGVIDAVGAGLYSTDAEIELPCVPLSFDVPEPGTVVLVRGRRGFRPWEAEVRLAADPRVTGLLLEPEGELARLTSDQVGAGVFWIEDDGRLRLLGLVSGRLELDGKHYVTAVGPHVLWRLVVHRRNSDRPRRWVYREDIL